MKPIIVRAESRTTLLLDSFRRTAELARRINSEMSKITINYLRISVTDRCNMHCRYCMPKGYSTHASSEALSPDEISKIVDTAINFGVDTVRMTGGEPLLRGDLTDIIKKISKIRSVKNIGITTNGSLLANAAHDLKRAGIGSVNISLDTLRRGRYHEISGSDLLPQVLKGIREANDTFEQVKINCVVMRHVNDDEIVDFLRIAENEKIIIRFIEFMPHLDCSMDFLFPGAEILGVVEDNFGKVKKISNTFGLGPAQYFKAENLEMPFGIISSVTSPPCPSCNRLRLTSDGRLLSCLYSVRHFDLKTPLRNGENIAPIFAKAIDAKKCPHVPPRKKLNMVELGG